MRKVFTIGETVFDLIFNKSQKVNAKPGGAMLNSAVSLGRLGTPVSFISEIGDDNTGKYILEFLTKNGVDTSFCYQFKDGQTALALAFLDENNNADYSFYKNYPNQRLTQKLPILNQEDILLFGSFFAITREVRKPLLEFIKQSQKQDAIIIYDPNFRKPHLHELPEIKNDILENISYSSIVRGSDEDFKLIFNADNADESFQILKENRCPILIYTSSNKAVEFRSEEFKFSLPVIPVKTISTIGAGDTFNAGIVYNLIKFGLRNKNLQDVKIETWKEIIKNAIQFGSFVCTHYDNYITHDFVNQIRS